MSKKAKASETIKFIELSYDQKQLYASNVFESTKQLVEDSLLNPDMELDFNDVDLCDCDN